MLYLPFFWFLCWYICKLNLWYINKVNLALPAIFRDLCWYICKLDLWYKNKVNLALPAVFRLLCWYICKLILWYINKVNLALPAVISKSLLIYMQIISKVYKQSKSCFTCRFFRDLCWYICKLNLWYINKVNPALPAVFLVSLLIYMQNISMICKQIKSCFTCRFCGIFADIYAN